MVPRNIGTASIRGKRNIEDRDVQDSKPHIRRFMERLSSWIKSRSVRRNSECNDLEVINCDVKVSGELTSIMAGSMVTLEDGVNRDLRKRCHVDQQRSQLILQSGSTNVSPVVRA